jgi:hypothetical protein
MLPTSPSRRSRLRSAVAPLALSVVLVAGSACGSDSDSSSDTGVETIESVAVADPPLDTAPVGTTAGAADTMPVDDSDDGGDASAECGGLNAADVGTAAGAEFDTADDISVDADLSCLFSNSTAADAVTVTTESVSTYLGGSLDGLSPEEALAQLETASTMFFDDAVVEQTTIAGFPAVIVTGTVMESGAGSGSAIVDGVVIDVSSSGSGLSPDGAGYAPIMAAVLELAVAAQG